MVKSTTVKSPDYLAALEYAREVFKGWSLRVTMPDGSKWDVPVSIIAIDNAKHYGENTEFGKSIERALREYTILLFHEDSSSVREWAENDMNWKDVKEWAVQVSPPTSVDYAIAWITGDKELVINCDQAQNTEAIKSTTMAVIPETSIEGG